MPDPGKCLHCASTENLRRCVLTFGDTPLRLQPLLCEEHSQSLVLRVGYVLGSLHRPISEVFLEFEKSF